MKGKLTRQQKLEIIAISKMMRGGWYLYSTTYIRALYGVSRARISNIMCDAGCARGAGAFVSLHSPGRGPYGRGSYKKKMVREKLAA